MSPHSKPSWGISWDHGISLSCSWDLEQGLGRVPPQTQQEVDTMGELGALVSESDLDCVPLLDPCLEKSVIFLLLFDSAIWRGFADHERQGVGRRRMWGWWVQEEAMDHFVPATAASPRLWHWHEHPSVHQSFGQSEEPRGHSADVFRKRVRWAEGLWLRQHSRALQEVATAELLSVPNDPGVWHLSSSDTPAENHLVPVSSGPVLCVLTGELAAVQKIELLTSMESTCLADGSEMLPFDQTNHTTTCWCTYLWALFGTEFIAMD